MNQINATVENLKVIARQNGKKAGRGEMTHSDAVMANSSNVFAIETENPELIPHPDALINYLDLLTEKAMG